MPWEGLKKAKKFDVRALLGSGQQATEKSAPQPLRSPFPEPRTLVTEEKGADRSARVFEICQKKVTFEGFTLTEAKWIKGVLKALDVPLVMLDRVDYQAEGFGAAQYVPETRTMIINRSLLIEAAQNDEKRAKRQPKHKGRPDSGKYILAYAIAHEVAGHSLDPNVHMTYGVNPLTGKPIAELPPEFRNMYSENFVEEITQENDAVIQFCEQSIKTGHYITDGRVEYHRRMCDLWRDALSWNRVGLIDGAALGQVRFLVIAEVRAMLVEQRLRGERDLKHLGKLQLRERVRGNSKDNITNGQKFEEAEQGFVTPLKLADALASRSFHQFSGGRLNQRAVRAHSDNFRFAIQMMPRSPFQLVPEGGK